MLKFPKGLTQYRFINVKYLETYKFSERSNEILSSRVGPKYFDIHSFHSFY